MQKVVCDGVGLV